MTIANAMPCKYHAKKYFYFFSFFVIDATINICRMIEKKVRQKMENMIDENGDEWMVGDDCGWDPIMGDYDDWIETDDEWLDDFQGEEEWA
jgi:hypothetical protein